MFSFTTNPTITITFDNQESRAKKSFKLSDKETVDIPIYNGQENISGVVDVIVPPGKKIEHQGIRIEMIGQTGRLQTLVFQTVKSPNLNNCPYFDAQSCITTREIVLSSPLWCAS